MFWFWKKRPPKPLAQRRWRWSRRISFWLHSIIVSVVAMECLMLVALPMPGQPAAQQVVLHAPPLAEPPPPEPVEIGAFVPHPEAEQWLAQDSVDIGHLEAAQADPRWAILTEGDYENRSREEQEAAENFVADKVMHAIKDAEQRSTEENHERLRKLTNQLNEVATEQSVADVTAQLSKLLGTGPRATEPAKEPVAGEFDLDSAQLHDVRREMQADGTFKYTAILIDADGRTQETEMPAAEGESAYKTFELMKQNPLLERVYRGVVMSLIDKMLKPSP